MDTHIVDKLFDLATKGDLSSIKEYAPLAKSVRNSKNQTLLHVAAGYGKTSLASYLISLGSDVNAQDVEQQSPLHNACCHGHFTISRKLIERGAIVNLVDNRGWSPLHFALARKDNVERISPLYKRVIDLLLESGADPHLKSLSGRSCLDRIKDSDDKRSVRLSHLMYQLKCCEGEMKDRDQIIDKFLSVPDYFEIVKQGDDILQVLQIVTTKKLLKSRLETCDNITPLHRAAGYNHLEIAKFLVQEGAEVDAKDLFGRIPIHNAAQYGHIDMIEFLVQQKSDINTQDLLGYSPLHVAASNRTYRACLTLLRLGADLNLKCQEGNLPFDLAEFGDVKEVLKPRSEVVTSISDLAIYVDLPSTAREEPVQYSSVFDQLMLDSSSDKPLFNNSNHKIKKIILPESDRRYQMVKERMLKTIMIHDNDLCGRYRSYEILAIELILNQKVWSNYRLMSQILENESGYKNEKLLFHGSNFIDNIQNHGFDERYAQRDGMFGTGIYFAKHSSKSNQYTFGWGQGCQKHSDKSCYICERKLVYAQVALGRSLVSKEAMPDCSHGPPGFSSVTGLPGSTDDLLYHEYVIYKGAQAYPLFVIRYRIVP